MAQLDEARTACSAQFAEIKVGELPQPKDGEVIEVAEDMNLLEAVKVMASKGISSCPITATGTNPGDNWRDRYVGMLDTVQIAFYLLDIAKEVLEHETSSDKLRQDPRVTQVQVGQLASSAMMSPFLALTLDNNLRDVMLIVGGFAIHRLPVVEEGSLVNLITQSALVNFLNTKSDIVAPITSMTLESLGMAEPRELHSVSHNSTLLEAMELIRAHNLAAVPVLGVNRALVGNVSAKDLRHLVLRGNLFAYLHQPVRKFISAISEADHEAMNPAISCRKHHTLDHVMQQLSASKIHRVYLVDERDVVQRVISLSDILALFSQEPEPGYLNASFSLS
eukprot:m.24174 g.24174  ORF g.24174 m.24174 type:complete len:336 (-) comp11477_c0_seq1:125-1132(-)